jgi:hypothetical protein
MGVRLAIRAINPQSYTNNTQILGQLHRHHFPRRPCHLLVCDPIHEWSEHDTSHARCHLAVVSHAPQFDPEGPGHYYEYHGLVLDLLDPTATIPVYAPE